MAGDTPTPVTGGMCTAHQSLLKLTRYPWDSVSFIPARLWDAMNSHQAVDVCEFLCWEPSFFKHVGERPPRPAVNYNHAIRNEKEKKNKNKNENENENENEMFAHRTYVVVGI